MDEFFTPKEIAENLKVDVRTVRRWLKEGELEGVKLGNRWRVKGEDFNKFIEQQKGAKDET